MNTSTKSLQLLSLLIADFCNKIGTKRRKTMSAPTSASGGESGNVANGPNSTLLTRSRPRLYRPPADRLQR
jgi:hypothetical protein